MCKLIIKKATSADDTDVTIQLGCLSLFSLINHNKFFSFLFLLLLKFTSCFFCFSFVFSFS